MDSYHCRVVVYTLPTHIYVQTPCKSETKMTVKHILLDCTVFNVKRQRFCLTDLFKNVSPECILEFLSSVDLKRLL